MALAQCPSVIEPETLDNILGFLLGVCGFAIDQVWVLRSGKLP
jgi:hypothetical protein